MANRTIVPFGPQHPVLPEPIHLDLVLEDEKVVEAIPSIGFVHRGLEELAGRRDFHDYQYVVERICGICSFKHGMAYCETLEQIFGAEVPPRAKYLRTIWGEMSRIHSHLLWLGLLADAFGFDALFMQCWRMREKVLDMFEASTGGRVIFSVNTIGGVLKDMDSDMLKSFVAIFDDMEKELHSLAHVFLNDYSVQSRRAVSVHWYYPPAGSQGARLPTDRAHQGDAQGRGHCARGAAAGRGVLLYESQRHQVFGALSCAHPYLYQFVCTTAHFARQRTGRCAAADPNY